MQLRAKLASVDGKAATSRDGPNKIGLKFAPMYLGQDDASWLFDHLGQYLDLEIGPAGVSLTPLEEAIAEAVEEEDEVEAEAVTVPSVGRRRNGTRSSERV